MQEWRNLSNRCNSANRLLEQEEIEETTLEGTWSGKYGGFDAQTATLVIDAHSDSSFSGTLTAIDNEGKEHKLAIKGMINQGTKETKFQEVELLSKSSNWFLGTNSGILSTDFRRMSGTGEDTNRYKYSWSFSKLEDSSVGSSVPSHQKR